MTKAPPATAKSLVWVMLLCMSGAAIIMSFLTKNEVRHLPKPEDIILHILYISFVLLIFVRSINVLVFHGAVLLFALSLYVAYISRDLLARFYDNVTKSGQIYVDSASEECILMAFYFIPPCTLGFGLSIVLFAVYYGLSGLIVSRVGH